MFGLSGLFGSNPTPITDKASFNQAVLQLQTESTTPDLKAISQVFIKAVSDFSSCAETIDNFLLQDTADSIANADNLFKTRLTTYYETIEQFRRKYVDAKFYQRNVQPIFLSIKEQLAGLKRKLQTSMAKHSLTLQQPAYVAPPSSIDLMQQKLNRLKGMGRGGKRKTKMVKKRKGSRKTRRYKH